MLPPPVSDAAIWKMTCAYFKQQKTRVTTEWLTQTQGHKKNKIKSRSASVPPLWLPPRRRTGQNINITKCNYKIPGICKGHIYFFSLKPFIGFGLFRGCTALKGPEVVLFWGFFLVFFKAVPYPNPPSWGIKAFEATRVLRPPSRKEIKCVSRRLFETFMLMRKSTAKRLMWCRSSDSVRE